ncbi:MAG TPA: hypothetical protein VHL08_03445 [Dongiaceae bacterium]|jgi:hypothetical protein|nr:hypothetical protein [Dongiaceae bacterium]
MRILFALSVFFLGLSFAYAQSEAPGGGALVDTPAEIHAVLDNLTIYGRYVSGEDWIEYHLPDGRTAYWEKGCTHPGKWWIEDTGQVCYSYRDYNDGRPNCFLMYRSKNGIMFAVGVGKGTQLASSSTKLAQGNSEHLPISDNKQCLGA